MGRGEKYVFDRLTAARFIYGKGVSWTVRDATAKRLFMRGPTRYGDLVPGPPDWYLDKFLCLIHTGLHDVDDASAQLAREFRLVER